MLVFEPLNKDQIAEISHFIAELNAQAVHEASGGWLGTQADEIAKQINELPDIPAEESFIVAQDENGTVGVLGFCAFLDKNMVRLLGPYIKHKNWTEIAVSLWQHLNKIIPDSITAYKLACNEKNKNCMNFANKMGFKRYNAEMEMIFGGKSLHKPPEPNKEVIVEEFSDTYYPEFKALHPTTVYFTDQEILNRLNDFYKLFIVREKPDFKGYIYVETEPDFGTAEICFVRVKEKVRGQGYGTMLLSHAMRWICCFDSIQDITLSVRPDNPGAIRLYKRFGFEASDVMVAFERSNAR
ncbi:MAG: GNAT family N-acetyltransferase [Candidatus Bipolaricaulia bacterium]